MVTSKTAKKDARLRDARIIFAAGAMMVGFGLVLLVLDYFLK